MEIVSGSQENVSSLIHYQNITVILGVNYRIELVRRENGRLFY